MVQMGGVGECNSLGSEWGGLMYMGGWMEDESAHPTMKRIYGQKGGQLRVLSSQGGRKERTLPSEKETYRGGRSQ